MEDLHNLIFPNHKLVRQNYLALDMDRDQSQNYFLDLIFYINLLELTNNAYHLLKSLNGVTPFLRREKNLLGAMALWSPFYGKINTFNKITYFDWFFGLGLGLLKSESNSDGFKGNGETNVFKNEEKWRI